MKKTVIAFILAMTSLFAEPDLSNASLYKADITSQTAYEMQQKGALIIDVRTQREFEFSRPKGAINIPVFYILS